jgi:hypothetical protein
MRDGCRPCNQGRQPSLRGKLCAKASPPVTCVVEAARQYLMTLLAVPFLIYFFVRWWLFELERGWSLGVTRV